jgi:hypothetical protein
MSRQQMLWHRFVTSTGFICLAASFMLMSAGVQTVSAEAGDEANMSMDLTLGAAPERAATAPPNVAPVVSIDDKEALARPGIGGVETQPGVIVLNTRGYHYGRRPGDLNPAALNLEGRRQN